MGGMGGGASRFSFSAGLSRALSDGQVSTRRHFCLGGGWI